MEGTEEANEATRNGIVFPHVVGEFGPSLVRTPAAYELRRALQGLFLSPHSLLSSLPPEALYARAPAQALLRTYM